jgi:FKBP-type peptidyl-prolyl cis-trans isomerase
MKLSNLIWVLPFVILACSSEPEKLMLMGYEYEHPVQTNEKKPAPGEYVLYDYYLKDETGKLLEASNEKGGPSEFRIPTPEAYPKKAALIELMKVMSKGDSARLFYPIDSLPATGGRFGDIKTLVYEVVLKDVKTAEEYEEIRQMQQAEADKMAEANQGKVDEIANLVAETLDGYKAGTLGDKLQKGPGGIEFVLHKDGEGDFIKRKDNVEAHYYGVRKSDGGRFDDSFSRGRPFTFTNGKGMVIQGWDEGFKMLKKGSAATLFIPYNMAYGENGRPPTIPAKADLVFYVEVVSVN